VINDILDFEHSLL